MPEDQSTRVSELLHHWTRGNEQALEDLLPLIFQELQRVAHVKDVLHQAMHMAPEQRSRFLNEACCGDAHMRAEVESLLAANAEILPGFLESSPRLEEELTGGPAELAADLGRYSRHEPVEARRASTAYRFRKYVRRHRVGVGIGTGLAVFLIAFAVLQTINVSRLTRERDRVERERSRAVRVTNLLTGMFKLDDSGEASGGTITAREILDQAVADTSTNMARDPDAQSQVMHLIARAYFNLGLLNRANQAAHTALETRRMLHGPDDPSTLESMAQMGWILGFQGQSAEAQRMERDALSRELRVLGPENAQTLETMHKLAVIDGTVGDHAEEQKLRHEIEVIRARLADSRMGGR